MEKYTIILMALLLSTLSYAENTILKFSYENFDFENSKQKYQGKRVGLIVTHKTKDAYYQIAYEKTNTDTYKPPLTQDLHVNKYYLKYTYKLDDKQRLSLSYATIDDNLMQEVDGGNIYGVGYKYDALSLNQYFSDYDHFNVYQTDVQYTFKKSFGKVFASATLMGKYIYLQDRENNVFSANAKRDYFTPGIRIHAHYGAYHMGVGAYFGKRIFAVMNDGFKVQDHAMEFDKTYMIGVGKNFGNVDLSVKYVYQEAIEIPIHNDNVKVKNIILQFAYRF